GADRRRDRAARLRAPDRAHAGRAALLPPRGGRGRRGGDEDAAGGPRRPGGDDRLLRQDPSGGGRHAQAPDVPLDPPRGRRAHRAPARHGPGLEGHPRAPPAGRGLGRPRPPLLKEGVRSYIPTFSPREALPRHSRKCRNVRPDPYGFQVLKRSRRTFLSNLPTLVLGTASMNTTSSGSHHLATRGFRYSRISSAVSWPANSGFGTTQARGRSTHVGWGTAITA